MIQYEIKLNQSELLHSNHHPIFRGLILVLLDYQHSKKENGFAHDDDIFFLVRLGLIKWEKNQCFYYYTFEDQHIC